MLKDITRHWVSNSRPESNTLTAQPRAFTEIKRDTALKLHCRQYHLAYSTATWLHITPDTKPHCQIPEQITPHCTLSHAIQLHNTIQHTHTFTYQNTTHQATPLHTIQQCTVTQHNIHQKAILIHTSLQG